MIYFIVNPTSRSGKCLDIWKQVRAYLRKNNVEYKAFETKHEGHATELARKLCKLPLDEVTIVTIGGDGTINEVLNGITDFDKVRFGVIPAGSGNDFARGLSISKDVLLQADVIINSKTTENIDLGRVTWWGAENTRSNHSDDNNDKNADIEQRACCAVKKSRIFAISAGVGLDAIVCKKALTSRLKKFLNKLKLGKLTYIILTVQTLFSMDTAEAKVSFDGEEEKSFSKLIFAAAMNFRAEGGGVPMAPRADAKDGLLSVCVVNGIPKWRTFFCLPLLVIAKHEKLKGFSVVNCRKCQITLDKPVVLHEDGEYCADVSRVTMECLPERLRLIV